jgi:plastocyanin
MGGGTPVLRLLAMILGAVLGAAPASAAPRAKSYVVTIQQMAFARPPANLHVGDRIEWVNADLFVHSATAADGSFDVELKPKARTTIVLRKAGTIPFACRYHPGMKGSLVVAK